MDIAGHKAHARLAGLGHLLQALHEGRPLAQVRPGVPVVYDVVQQLRMPKPVKRSARDSGASRDFAHPPCTAEASNDSATWWVPAQSHRWHSCGPCGKAANRPTYQTPCTKFSCLNRKEFLKARHRGWGALVNNAGCQASLLQGALDERQVFEGGEGQLTQGQLGKADWHCRADHEVLNSRWQCCNAAHHPTVLRNQGELTACVPVQLRGRLMGVIKLFLATVLLRHSKAHATCIEWNHYVNLGKYSSAKGQRGPHRAKRAS